jgi:hypothetical protein
VLGRVVSELLDPLPIGGVQAAQELVQRAENL